jgi:hypothetical protein
MSRRSNLLVVIGWKGEFQAPASRSLTRSVEGVGLTWWA